MEGNDSPEKGIHMHCLNCWRNDCMKFPACPLIKCQCGIALHACKTEEHSSICRRRLRPCVNQTNGCPFKLDSVSMISHLECCPASVVYCSMNWNRHPIYSKERTESLPFYVGNPVQIAGDLDTEFAISDQIRLAKEFKARMRKGKQYRDKCTKFRVPPQRIAELEYLLTGRHDENRITNCNTNQEETNHAAFENAQEPEENSENFNLSDEAMTSMLDLSTHFSNAAIQKTACVIPNQSTDYEQIVSEPTTEKQDRNISHDEGDDGEFTEEEYKKQRTVYSQLNHSYFPLGLSVMLRRLSAFQKYYPIYNIYCSKFFRRDQYTWHVQNIHLDIQDSLNCNMFKRCPLYDHGCPHLQFTLKPKQGAVRFCRDFDSFVTAYENNLISEEAFTENICLLDLHYDILLYILGFLDNMSLNILAKTCHAFQDVCSDVLERRGIILPIWEKKSYDSGSSWKIKKNIQRFTTSISPIREWVYTDNPCIGNHMLDCPFFKRHRLVDKVELPGFNR